jgi:hypothetical protein
MSMNKKKVIDMGKILFSLDHMNKKKTFTRSVSDRTPFWLFT